MKTSSLAARTSDNRTLLGPIVRSLIRQAILLSSRAGHDEGYVMIRATGPARVPGIPGNRPVRATALPRVQVKASPYHRLPSGGIFKMSSPACIALLGILAPLVGFFEKVAEIFASRAEKISGPSSTVCTRALQTHDEQLPNQASLRSDRVLGGAVLLFSAYLRGPGTAGLGAFAGRRAAAGASPGRRPDLRRGTAGGTGIWNSLRLAHAAAGSPLNSCEAEIELTGTRDQVTRECLHAMIGIGAIRAAAAAFPASRAS